MTTPIKGDSSQNPNINESMLSSKVQETEKKVKVEDSQNMSAMGIDTQEVVAPQKKKSVKQPTAENPEIGTPSTESDPKMLQKRFTEILKKLEKSENFFLTGSYLVDLSMIYQELKKSLSTMQMREVEEQVNQNKESFARLLDICNSIQKQAEIEQKLDMNKAMTALGTGIASLATSSIAASGIGKLSKTKLGNDGQDLGTEKSESAQWLDHVARSAEQSSETASKMLDSASKQEISQQTQTQKVSQTMQEMSDKRQEACKEAAKSFREFIDLLIQSQQRMDEKARQISISAHA